VTAVARKPKQAPNTESNEDRLIARHFKPIARDPGALGLIDDAAVLSPPPGHDLIVTADAIVGGVHFFSDDPADAIARKALRVNLSDLAAKGAKPAGFLVSLALPKSAGEPWLKGFARGLGSDAKDYDCPLLGGDTVRTPGPLMVTVAAFGTLPSGAMVRRNGAKVGDHVMVTGTIGDAALGLKLRTDRDAARRWKLSSGERNHLVRRYLTPQPRNALAFAVRKYATAAMDVSDGLAGDLGKLCRASGVGAVVDVTRVPLSAAARAVLETESKLLTAILSGGDDYEIVCTVRPGRLTAFQAAARAVGMPVADIGRIVRGAGASFLRSNGKALTFARASFSHF
jgi:thiamine-monophosphate kinase